MTMKGKWLATGLLAAAGLVASTAPARAGDTIRLAGTGDAPTQNLVDDGKGADTIDAHWHGGWGGGFRYGGGFGYGGGFRYGGGFGYGGRLGWGGGWGGWGGGLGYGARFYGGGFGYRPFYRPYYGGFGYGYGGLGLGGFGYGYGYGGGFYPGYWGPCSGTSAAVFTLNMPQAGLSIVPPGEPVAPGDASGRGPAVAPPAAGEQTFPYDGGPQDPVPVPRAGPSPTTTPRPTVPLEGRAVSLPKKPAKLAYPAYGERPSRSTSFAEDRTLLTKDQPRK
jgi:hypothetical protein